MTAPARSRANTKPALPPFDPRLRYSIPEAAGYLKLSQSYVYLRISRGEIPTMKDGKRTFIAGSVIAALSSAAA